MINSFNQDVEEFFCSESLSILTKIIEKNSITGVEHSTGYFVTLYNKCGNTIRGLPTKIDRNNSSVLLDCREQKTYSIIPLSSISFIEIHNPKIRVDIDTVTGFEHNDIELQYDDSLDIESYLIDTENMLKANEISHISLSLKEIENINNAIVKHRVRDLVDIAASFLITTYKEDDTGKSAISEISQIEFIGKANSTLHIRRKKGLVYFECDFSNSLPIKLSTSVSDKFENIL